MALVFKDLGCSTKKVLWQPSITINFFNSIQQSYFTETLTFTAKAPMKQEKQETKSVSFSCPPDCSCQILEPECPQDCPCRTTCPPGCPCKTRSSKTSQMFFYAAGVVVAILAMYLIVSTDSKVYLVFWVVYSVLRRMILKSKKVSLKAKTDWLPSSVQKYLPVRHLCKKYSECAFA